jgi:hypothetical protein
MHLTGRHDVDQGWLKDVRTVGENATAPLIVPRFMFHGWLLEDYQILFSEQALINQLIALLVRECVYVPHLTIAIAPHGARYVREPYSPRSGSDMQSPELRWPCAGAQLRPEHSDLALHYRPCQRVARTQHEDHPRHSGKL